MKDYEGRAAHARERAEANGGGARADGRRGEESTQLFGKEERSACTDGVRTVATGQQVTYPRA